MRIGIYSGSFDPIHEGHVLFAQVSAEQFGLDKVLLLPEPQPRYKESVTDIEHRQRMCELATISNSSEIQTVVFDDLPHHTINGVLRHVYEMHPEDEYFILMGSDVFRHIEKWGERDDEDGSIADISGNIGFIVGIEKMSELAELKEISEKLGLNARYVEPPLMALSSRKIRERIKEGSSVEVAGVNDDVGRYIKLESLYGAQQD